MANYPIFAKDNWASQQVGIQPTTFSGTPLPSSPYAMGGQSPGGLQSFYDQNKGNPQAVSQYMQQNGYSNQSAAKELGIDPGYVSNYLGSGQSSSPYGASAAAPAAPAAPAAAPGIGAVGYGGGSGAKYGGSAPSSNPYLTGAQEGIARRMNDNLQRNVLPQMGTSAMAAGGYGDSAHGVLQANAVRDMNNGLGDTFANMNSGDWNNQQNRNMSRYGMDQNFYTAQRGQDQTGMALGANLYSQGMNGPWDALNNAAQGYSRFTGLGTQTNQTGGGAQGAAGGMLAGAQLGNNLGWWK
jgi:hypothetical protein